MKNERMDWLTFTRGERVGVLTLLAINFLCWTAPAFFSRFQPREAVDFSVFEAQVAQLERTRSEGTATNNDGPPETALKPFDPNLADEASLVRLGLSPSVVRTLIRYRDKGGRFRRADDLRKIYGLTPADYERLAPYIRITESKQARPGNPRASRVGQRLFPFDPNTVTEAELATLGLSAGVIRTWLKYRSRGGRFTSADDLTRIYGMTPSEASRLRPYVRMESRPADHAVSQPQKRRYPTASPPIEIDINRADAASWRQLRGIGPVLADRIVHFRDKLGGFISVDQVADTYGLPDSTFASIRPQLRTSPLFRPLAINRLDWESLGQHPYIDRRMARAIVSYREQHGPFTSVEEVRKVRAISEPRHRQLAPYWSFEQ